MCFSRTKCDCSLVGCLTSQQHASVSQGQTCLTSQQHASVSQGQTCLTSQQHASISQGRTKCERHKQRTASSTQMFCFGLFLFCVIVLCFDLVRKGFSFVVCCCVSLFVLLCCYHFLAFRFVVFCFGLCTVLAYFALF